MFPAVLPYLVFIVLGASAAVLLTSKKLSEKLVTAGMLPRTFLGLVPILQLVIRIFGGAMVAAGVIKIGMDSGWIDAQLVARYAFPASLIVFGAVLLFLNRRN